VFRSLTSKIEEYHKLVKFFKSSKRSVAKRIGTTKLRQNLQNKTKQNKLTSSFACTQTQRRKKGALSAAMRGDRLRM
jgi:hypothetical protein